VPVESSRQHRAPTSGCTVRYTHSYASHARERAVLTDKALWAMNAVPERLSQRLGSQLIAMPRNRGHPMKENAS
jgi:hypothetical protein